MADTPNFLGILFPYVKGTKGIPATATDAEIIKSDLSLLMHTRKKERVMLPEFGTDFEKLVFENTGPLLRAKAFRMAADAIGNHEPRISLVNVIITEDGNDVQIDVIYTIDNIELDKISLFFDRDS